MTPDPATTAEKTTTGTSEKTEKRSNPTNIPIAALRTTIIMVQCSILERTNFLFIWAPPPFIHPAN